MPAKGTLLLTVALTVALLGAGRAEWRDERAVFRVGLSSASPAVAAPELQRLKDVFAGAVGLPVEIVVVEGPARLADAQANGRLDYAVYSASGFAAARRFCSCVDAIVRPVSADGATGWRSILVARTEAGGDLQRILKTKVLIGPEDDMARHVVPFAALRGQQIELDAASDAMEVVQTAEAAESRFAKGEADAMFGWEPEGSADPASGTVERLVAGGMARGTVAAAWRSDPIPYGPHAVSTAVPQDVRDRLADVLRGLRESDPALYELLAPFGGGGFVAAANADYDGLAALLAVSGETQIEAGETGTAADPVD